MFDYHKHGKDKDKNKKRNQNEDNNDKESRGESNKEKEQKRKEETTKETHNHSGINKAKVGEIVRDQQIRLNINCKRKISNSDDSAEYIKEGCVETIGKTPETVSSGGERNSNGEHWQIL
eukprot:5298579-Ditylum_brightwellii.AAC.1